MYIQADKRVTANQCFAQLAKKSVWRLKSMTKVDTHSREELRVEGADPELDSKIYVMYVQLICGNV